MKTQPTSSNDIYIYIYIVLQKNEIPECRGGSKTFFWGWTFNKCLKIFDHIYFLDQPNWFSKLSQSTKKTPFWLICCVVGENLKKQAKNIWRHFLDSFQLYVTMMPEMLVFEVWILIQKSSAVFFSFWGLVVVNKIDMASLLSFILLKPHSMRWTHKIVCAGLFLTQGTCRYKTSIFHYFYGILRELSQLVMIWVVNGFLGCQSKYVRTSFTWLLATPWLTLAAVMVQSESSSKKRHWLAKRDHWCTKLSKIA